MRRLLLCVVLVLWCTLSKAQYEGMEYYWEQDSAVKAKLERWQDLKFGFFVHWGPYSQKGYCESWTIWIGFNGTRRFLMTSITGITWI